MLSDSQLILNKKVKIAGRTLDACRQWMDVDALFDIGSLGREGK